jgi:soluble lytic murein transglycosylase-like protein
MKIAFLLLMASPALAAKAPLLPKDLEDFLGVPPPRFEQKFRRPARELKAALELLHDKKSEAGIKKLQGLLNGEMGEHASFELALAYREKKDFKRSTSQAEKILRSYPGTIYGERARDLLDQNECDHGLMVKARAELQACLWRAPWKTWAELEAQATALYELLRKEKDPLLDPFVAELIQAMPASNPLRQRIAKEIPNDKLESLANMARFRSKSANPAGVKAVNPDLEVFDGAMKLVLKEEWEDANAIFKRFLTDFPQSEHIDRAQFWVARTEERMGNKDEAQKRFAQILTDNPFTYYGLQAAIYLKHDWATALAAAPRPIQAKFTGSPLTLQALSLWRLRALLEAGALEPAREEARFLFQLKPGGSTLGQSEAMGAVLMARLFGEANHYMAVFSHAYAAVSLDPALSAQVTNLIFPRLFESDFTAAAEKAGVHPSLLLSVAKQESAFLPNAVSRADALGLMQLLLSTAKEMVPGVSRETLFEPATNTKAGALYLQKLLLRFEGNIALALAAYNAGPSRAVAWQKDIMEAPLMKKAFDPDAFIDSIPFSETRKYVGNILRNYAWYKLIAKDGTITSIQELMFQWQKPASPSAASPPSPSTPPQQLPGPVKPSS